MRRRRRVRGGVIVGIAAGICVGGLGQNSIAQTQVQVLEFPGPFERDVDIGKSGLGPGDVHLEISDLLDPADESVVGRSILKVEIVRLHRRGEDVTFILDCTAQLPEGWIAFYGGLRSSDLVDGDGAALPVIGGTGAYAGATGTVTIEPADVTGEEGFSWTFDLITP